MSSNLQIVSCKPNPAGKDKTSSGSPKPEQLVAEWVEMKNIGDEAVRLLTIALHQTQFTDRCAESGTQQYWKCGGNDILLAGQTLRVHTGKQSWQHLLAGEDLGNPSWRSFAELDRFVLNNRCGDTIYVTWLSQNNTKYQDSASYDRNPPEGRILYRVKDKLRSI